MNGRVVVGTLFFPHQCPLTDAPSRTSPFSSSVSNQEDLLLITGIQATSFASGLEVGLESLGFEPNAIIDGDSEGPGDMG